MPAYDPLALSEQLFSGELSIDERHPVTLDVKTQLSELRPGTAFVESLANVACFDTGSSLVLVDCGGVGHMHQVHQVIRDWTASRLHTVVYTHGHVDHVFGINVFANEEDLSDTTVIAHAAVPARFDRYILTNGYNAQINRRQFRLPQPWWPSEYRYPDVTYDDEMTVQVDGLTFEIRHDRGETDDHSWVWVPEQKVLCTGDLFIWAACNCGNPQKVQRYPADWAAALTKMADLGAELLLPGHGLPIAGEERVRVALVDTAEFLSSIHDQTVALMNEGRTLNEIVHSVTVPHHLLDKPYLQPVYDEPEFIVRNTWRLYGGWYSGDPAELKPAPAAQLAQELARLAGGAGVLADRAVALAAAGELRLAGHLAQLAVQATPDSTEAHRARAEVYRLRTEAERSTMASGIFNAAAEDSEKRLL